MEASRCHLVPFVGCLDPPHLHFLRVEDEGGPGTEPVGVAMATFTVAVLRMCPALSLIGWAGTMNAEGPTQALRVWVQIIREEV